MRKPFFVIGISRLFLEISVVESLESGAVACLVLAHLVYGVVDCVKVVLLCEPCDAEFVFACAVLCIHPLLDIGLGVPYALSEELSKFCSMLSLFPCISLEGLCNLDILPCLPGGSWQDTFPLLRTRR